MTRPEVEKAVEVRIDSSTGHAIFIYEEGAEELVQDIGGEIVKIDRASLVEWKQVGKDRGWIVWSARRPAYGLRRLGNGELKVDCKGPFAFFKTKAQALAAEKKFFWKLLEPKARYGRVR